MKMQCSRTERKLIHASLKSKNLSFLVNRKKGGPDESGHPEPSPTVLPTPPSLNSLFLFRLEEGKKKRVALPHCKQFPICLFPKKTWLSLTPKYQLIICKTENYYYYYYYSISLKFGTKKKKENPSHH